MGYIMLYFQEPYSEPTASSLLKPTEESPDYHVADHSNRYLVETIDGNRSDSDSSNSGDDSSSDDDSDSADILDNDSLITAVNISFIYLSFYCISTNLIIIYDWVLILINIYNFRSIQ